MQCSIDCKRLRGLTYLANPKGVLAPSVRITYSISIPFVVFYTCNLLIVQFTIRTIVTQRSRVGDNINIEKKSEPFNQKVRFPILFTKVYVMVNLLNVI